MPDVEQVRQLIRSAFPSQTFFGVVTGGCRCDECTGLESSLRHKSWEELPDETIDVQFGSLPLLSAGAFQAFLPAWLIRSLYDHDARDHKIREWMLYELALYHLDDDPPEDLFRKTERLRERSEHLTPGTLAAVRAVLTFIQEHCPISDWDRESIDRAVDLVWQPAPRLQ
jgi:hypothetical protein